ncbi:MAG: D-alanyl-D-alanine carboxypeptidase family protein [Clostridia bacterium]|nr:D-alanyl-D-alanine carboxypeptidase family protein [Clostridia bacterium]
MLVKKFKLLIFIVLLLLILSFIFPVSSFGFNETSINVWSNNSSLDTSITPNFNDESSGNFLEITSGSAILMEQKTGNILYEYNSHEQLRPASVTKVMTLLLIMEALDNGTITLEDKVSCSEKANSMGGSQIWLDSTETLTVHEMLKAICIVSANDCSMAMSEYICGSHELFVEQMNNKAKELGMNDTCFKNCHGLDEDGHLTSSYDIALMSRELITKHPKIIEYTTTWMDTLRNGESELVNTNKLIRNYQGTTGLKTGSTSTALFNLSATATRDNLSLISVIMKGETSNIRFEEAKKLLDYGFSNFQYIDCSKKDDIVKTLNIDKGIYSTVDAIFEEDSGCLIKKGTANNIISNVQLNNQVSAPISKGQKLGEVTYSIDDKIISKVNIVAKEEVKKLNFVNMSARIIESWFTLLR